jgi:hypothetical protein
LVETETVSDVGMSGLEIVAHSLLASYPDDGEFVTDYASGGVLMKHRDGVSWLDVSPPRRWHRCYAQTRGVDSMRVIERCPCGATRTYGVWFGKNETRKARRWHSPSS